MLVLSPIRRAPLWEIPSPNAGNLTSAPAAAALFDSLPEWIWMLCPIAVVIAAIIAYLLWKKRKKKGGK